MKRLITCALGVFFAAAAVSIAAPTEDQMLEKEKAAWQAFKDKNADGFKKVVSSEMIGVYADGIADMTKEMADMQKWDMKSFEISDYKISSVGPGLVMSTYLVKIEGTFNGNDASGTYNAGSVWHSRGGRGDWMAVFHTNVKQMGATTEAQKKE